MTALWIRQPLPDYDELQLVCNGPDCNEVFNWFPHLVHAEEEASLEDWLCSGEDRHYCSKCKPGNTGGK